jgi:hypothetical protein
MPRPSFVLVANAKEHSIIPRFLKAAEQEAFNKEEDQEKIDQYMDFSEKFEKLKKASRRGNNPECYIERGLECNLSLYKLIKSVDGLFAKRVHIIRDHTGSEVLPTVQSFAQRYKAILVNVQECMKAASGNPEFSELIENELEMRSF